MSVLKNNAKRLITTNLLQILYIFIAFLAMVLVSYFYASDIVRGQMEVISQEVMNSTQTTVSSSLMETELIFSNVVQTVEDMVIAPKSNTEILEYLIHTNNYYDNQSPMPGFMKIYGYVRQEWLDGSGWVPPPEYDPTSRPWFIGADQNNGEIYFSEPYIDSETGGMCISFSHELFDSQGRSAGVLAIDMKLSRITDYIREQKITSNGYGMLIDDKLYFSTHQNEALIGINIMEAGGDYPNLAGLLSQSDSVSVERFTDYNGIECVAFFRTIFNGWHIGIITPHQNYYKQVYELALVLSILGALLMVSLSYLVVRMRAQKERADEESRSKSNFLARMSHEMRTPMNAIIGMTGIAKTSDDMSRIKYSLDKIEAASTHLLGVINDALDMSKIEAGKLELSETTFSLESVIEQVKTVVSYKIEEKHQSFKIEIGSDVPAVITSDSQRLAQVITNLISNANKFTPEGGNITLTIDRLPDDLHGAYVLRFNVTDNGIGISEEQQSKLFRSFEQGDVSISRKYGGTGLGLAISKKIVELMGGDITIHSTPGNGASFIFTIFAKPGTLRETGEDFGRNPKLNADGLFSGISMLLVEDVAINREIVTTLLEPTGITIYQAENGREAVEAFAENPGLYNIIFMDIHMPELDGYDATKQIRSMRIPQARSIPIIAMTANVFREDIEKCLAAGMNDHTGKPIQIEDIISKISVYSARG